MLSIPVLLLVCSQDWTGNLQMIITLEAYGTNTYNRYASRTHSVTVIGVGSLIIKISWFHIYIIQRKKKVFQISISYELKIEQSRLDKIPAVDCIKASNCVGTLVLEVVQTSENGSGMTARNSSLLVKSLEIKFNVTKTQNIQQLQEIHHWRGTPALKRQNWQYKNIYTYIYIYNLAPLNILSLILPVTSDT